MDARDQQLIRLLSSNARTSTTKLARDMGLSRSTVQDRISRLEREGIITGYTVRLSSETAQRQIKAHVMIAIDPKYRSSVNTALTKMDNISALYAINGEFDLIAVLTCDSTEDVDETLDQMGETTGITRTQSAILLSTKFER